MSESIVRRAATHVLSALRGVVVPILLLVAASVGYVAVNVSEHPALSPYDEYVYVDYLAKIPTEGFVHTGEETGRVAREALSCRGVLFYSNNAQPCGSAPYDLDAIYPYGGHTGADIYSPMYFAATWVIAQPLVWAGMDLVDAGRSVGALWLALGAVGIWVLIRLARVDGLYGLGLALVIMATPAVYWSTTYVTTDAPALAVGAWLGVLGVFVWQRRLYVLLPVLAMVAALLKVQNLAAVGAVGLFLVLAVAVTTRGGLGRRLARVFSDPRSLIGIASIVAGLVAAVAWLWIRSSAALPGIPAAIDTDRRPLLPKSLATEAFRFLTNVGGPAMPASAFPIAVAYALTVITIAAIVGLIVDQRWRRGLGAVVAVSVLVVALLLGPGLAVFTRLSQGYYTPLSERYGLPLLPLFLLIIALYLRHLKRVVPSVVAIGGAAAVVTVLVVGIFP